MRGPARWLFHIFSILSLILFVLGTGAWYRSYEHHDEVYYESTSINVGCISELGVLAIGGVLHNPIDKPRGFQYLIRVPISIRLSSATYVISIGWDLAGVGALRFRRSPVIKLISSPFLTGFWCWFLVRGRPCGLSGFVVVGSGAPTPVTSALMI